MPSAQTVLVLLRPDSCGELVREFPGSRSLSVSKGTATSSHTPENDNGDRGRVLVRYVL